MVGWAADPISILRGIISVDVSTGRCRNGIDKRLQARGRRHGLAQRAKDIYHRGRTSESDVVVRPRQRVSDIRDGGRRGIGVRIVESANRGAYVFCSLPCSCSCRYRRSCTASNSACRSRIGIRSVQRERTREPGARYRTRKFRLSHGAGSRRCLRHGRHQEYTPIVRPVGSGSRCCCTRAAAPRKSHDGIVGITQAGVVQRD